MKRLVASAATTAIAMSIGAVAHAQSTATQVQELVVTGAREAINTGGLATQVKEAKDESIVTQAFFATQTGSRNFAQLINFLPGVSYSSEDYTGITSGDLRIHGFDGAHVAIILDGSPLNDTGNYAAYPGEYLVSELTDHVTVNIGATDVDSPSASAVGGTVNIVSKIPPKDMGFIVKGSLGSYNYRRIYAEGDTGTIGPTGATAYAAINYTDADKWRGSGKLSRFGVDGRIYQPLNGSDFISIAGTFVRERPIFYYSASRAQLAQYGYNFDYNQTWQVPTVTPGKADGVPSSAGPAGSDSNYYRLHPNPVDFATIRGQSRFSLTDKLTFTFDPSFFYTIANGGGTTSLSECDKRILGKTTLCKDLNGDGDTLDTVLVYSPSNTQTYRYGLSSSLLYDLDEHNHFQLAYTLDYGRHRQTGEMTPIDQTSGIPADVFGAKPGYGPPISTSDGLTLRTRDRFSIATLNQISFNYIGKFMDDRLHVNLGVRDPHFQRDLNQFCYTYNGTSAYCTGADPAAILAAYNAGVAAHNATALAAYIPGVTYNAAAGAPNFRMPFSQTIKYDKVLPNAGATYAIADHQSVYVTYAQGFSAPKTDDLYTSTPQTVQPESSTEYGVGYRYQAPNITASVNLYETDYKNRIVQSYDPNDPTLSVDRNVGAVRVRGLDLEGGWTPIEHLNVYASASFVDSELKSNYVLSTSGVTFALPTKGKELVMTPDQQYSARVTYDFGPVTVGADGKYISSRYISDLNDDRIPAYAIFNMDARWNMPYFGGKSYIQANIYNLLNRKYISRSSTVGNAYPYAIPGTALTYAPSTPFLYTGAPITFTLTLNAQF